MNAERVIAAALERRLGSLPMGTRIRLMLEQPILDNTGRPRPGPHTAGFLERLTPDAVRIKLLDSIEAGRTARALLEEELLDVVVGRGYPPSIRLTASGSI